MSYPVTYSTLSLLFSILRGYIYKKRISHAETLISPVSQCIIVNFRKLYVKHNMFFHGIIMMIDNVIFCKTSSSVFVIYSQKKYCKWKLIFSFLLKWYIVILIITWINSVAKKMSFLKPPYQLLCISTFENS